MSSASRLITLCILALGLAGCLDTQNRRVQLEDELRQEKYEKLLQTRIKKTYVEKLVEASERKQKLAIPEDLRLRMVYREDSTRAYDRIYDSIPADPFEAFELERARVLNRRWTDINGPPTD